MDYVDVHDFCSVSALVMGAPGMREDTAPKASGCFLGGTQEIFGAVSEDLLGGAGKAEDVKLQGAGIIPKLCPMERAGTEAIQGSKSYSLLRETAEPCREANRVMSSGNRLLRRRPTLRRRENAMVCEGRLQKRSFC